MVRGTQSNACISLRASCIRFGVVGSGDSVASISFRLVRGSQSSACISLRIVGGGIGTSGIDFRLIRGSQCSACVGFRASRIRFGIVGSSDGAGGIGFRLIRSSLGCVGSSLCSLCLSLGSQRIRGGLIGSALHRSNRCIGRIELSARYSLGTRRIERGIVDAGDLLRLDVNHTAAANDRLPGAFGIDINALGPLDRCQSGQAFYTQVTSAGEDVHGGSRNHRQATGLEPYNARTVGV